MGPLSLVCESKGALNFYMGHRVINGARKSTTTIIVDLDLSYSLEKFAASVDHNFL